MPKSWLEVKHRDLNSKEQQAQVRSRPLGPQQDAGAVSRPGSLSRSMSFVRVCVRARVCARMLDYETFVFIDEVFDVCVCV